MAIWNVAVLCMAFRGAVSYEWDTTVPAGAYCQSETINTCKILGCGSQEGSVCVGGKCVCTRPGREAKTCYVGGKCRNVIAGSCGSHFWQSKECAKTLGPVDCLGGLCVCRQHTYYKGVRDAHYEGCVPASGYRLAIDGESLCKRSWKAADIKLDGEKKCSSSCCKFQVTNFPYIAKVTSPEYCVVESGPLANQTVECQPQVGSLASADTDAHVEYAVPFANMVCLSAIVAVGLLVAVRLRVKAKDVQVNKASLLEQ